jgi:hypothetical protein
MLVARRTFLLGVSALIASTAIAKRAKFFGKVLCCWGPPAPAIWGDGIHDDAPGIQAAIDGREFEAMKGVYLLDRQIFLPPGVYRLDEFGFHLL